MAWPFDGDGENPIISGLVAGRRFALLEEELAMSRLQRAEYEATEGHRKLLRTLAAEREGVELRRSRLGEDLNKIQLEAAQFALKTDREDRPVRQGLLQAELSSAQTGAKRAQVELGRSEFESTQARANAPLVREALELDVAGRKSQAKREEIDLAASQVDLTAKQLNAAAGIGRNIGTEVGLEDVMSMVNTLGVKDDSAKSMMAMMILEGVGEAKRELEENKSILRNREIEQATQIAEAAAAAAERGPAYVEALGVTLGQDNPIFRAAKDTLEGGGLPQTARIDPLTLELGKGQISELFAQRREIRKQISDLNTQIAATSKDKKKAEFRSQIEKLQTELSELDKQLKVPSGESSARSAPQLRRIRTVEEYQKLPKGTRFIDPNGVERVKQ